MMARERSTADAQRRLRLTQVVTGFFANRPAMSALRYRSSHSGTTRFGAGDVSANEKACKRVAANAAFPSSLTKRKLCRPPRKLGNRARSDLSGGGAQK